MHKSLSTFALFAFSTTLLAQCPSVGTWKPADPRKNVKAVITEQGDNLQVIFTAISADGSPYSLKFTVPLKGGIGEVQESSGRLDGVTSKIVSPFVRENTYSRGGKQTRFDRVECSKDGKTMTGTESGVDVHGKPFNGTFVYTKQ
jgi:hypothetical protein